jgi:hypothetical protein
MKYLFIVLLLLGVLEVKSQESQDILPYESIPDFPEEYNAATTAARVVDGLGYRYYWATEGLREEDLHYQPSETSRTSMQTLEHIYGLVRTIDIATQGMPNESMEKEDLTYEELRRRTLIHIHQASENLKNSMNGDVSGMVLIFKRGENTREYPFWNLLNGPIADALWHTGQVVAFRRASGNPLNPNVSVFTGKTGK